MYPIDQIVYDRNFYFVNFPNLDEGKMKTKQI